MSIALPFLAVLIAGMFAAYHRLRLAVWAAISATLLVASWLLALLGLLAGAVLGFAHGVRLFTRSAPPQKLDDEPPPAAPRTPVRFGSDRF